MLLAICLGASSSRWQNDINIWVVAAPTGNRLIDFLAGFLESERDIAERDIAGETENNHPCEGHLRADPLPLESL